MQFSDAGGPGLWAAAKDLIARDGARGFHHGAWKFRHYKCA